jgi:electron-transferring-flavoprotein dehydrogenase
VAVIEKGKVPGAHLLSGANMRPSAMRELFPDLDPKDWPVYQEVTKDAVYLLTKRRALPLVPMPPNFRNHGNYVTSVSKLGRFLAEKAEEAGVYILSETTADKLLVEDRIVRGVRSGDRGRGRDGEELQNFEPGSDVIAKATVLAEGTLGHLTYAAMDYFDLHGADPMRWEIGVKEVWEVPQPLDRVIHTLGWPLRKRAKYNEFGGSFIYPMGEDKVCIGLVVGLDYTDATFSPHDALQLLKTHPFVRKILEGGKRVAWGAKTIPSGGYWSMPKRLAVPGMVIAGDAASMVNVSELKGLHYGMHAGMYAAETIVDALRKDPESVNFEAFDEKVHNSLIEKDLYRSRNMRQAPDKGGFFVSGVLGSLMILTRGWFPGGHWRNHPDAIHEMEIGKAREMYPAPDGKYTFDKLSSVFLSGNATRDDAPNHVRVQGEVPIEIAQTWVSMCPAQVYEIPDEQLESGAAVVDVHVTASNCVQCGAITAKGGRLTLPEGGDGPLYQEL